MRLLDFLFPPRPDQVLIRDLGNDDFLSRLRLRAVAYTSPETITLFSFADPVVRASIHEAKYHGNVHAFALLSSALVEYLRDADDGFRTPIILPIPLGRARQKERGYNQTEETALLATKELRIPVDTTLLIRTRETTSQVSLPRDARVENMRGAFRATHPLTPARTYILIDDVITTGATLQSAIDALRNAGAVHIIPLALAH